ncbi:MAG: Gfo/Idh/MocA family oxidoreductase [Actinomycetota bacterium]|nr:Gfo/Idh/MocA family oxidoreductase [Actinomycetota bacterium]
MKKINTGVIGTGFIGPSHIEALRRLGYVNIIATADINKKVAKEKAEQLNVDKFYGDYKELLAEKSIEVVHVCTPNHLHYPIVKEVLLAGKHVVCEKPLAINPEQGRDLLKLVKKTGLVAAVHFNLRFYPLVQQAKAMIEAGEIGDILAINGSYQQDWLLYRTDYNWRLESEFSGKSRAVVDIGSHWLDMVEYISGIKIEKVYADFCTFFKTRKKPVKSIETYTGKILKSSDYKDIKINTEDYATVLLRFNNGAHGSMTVNQAAAGRKNRLAFELYGTKMSIAWNSENPNEMWIGKRDSKNELLIKDPSIMNSSVRQYSSYPGGHAEGFPDTSKQLFNNVYKQISAGKEPGFDFPTFEDGYRELILCDVIFDSALKEKWKEVK